MSTRTRNRLLVFFIVLTLSCMCSLMAFAYDGGPWCFFAPKKCPLNRGPKPIGTPVHAAEKPTLESTETLWPTPTQFDPPTPTATLDPEITPTAVQELTTERQRYKVNCGRNPYRFNYMEDNWERPFEELCFVATNDPFDVVFGGDAEWFGYDYDQVIFVLGLLEADPNSKDSQVQTLVEAGLWDPACQCIPEGTSVEKVVLDVLSGPTATPTPEEPADKEIGG